MDTKELFYKLVDERNKLKRKFYSNARTPVICSDSSLYELALKAPRNKEDILGIKGLGPTFIDKYGDYFMKIIDEYHKSNTETKELKSEVKSTLKNLENRLVNISRKNRLLYMGKIYNKYALDLYADSISYNRRIIDLLMGRIDSLLLCDISYKKVTDIDNEQRFKKASILLREITKEFRESGQYDLYIGYPYVVGKTKGEDFNVRAPLVLFPIEFDKQVDKIILKIDKTKDILYNNNLILMQNKFINNNDELPNNSLEDINPDEFFANVINFYKDYDIDIQMNMGELQKFQDILVDDFPKYYNGEFHMVNNAVLGKFSLYSSAIQKDLKQMIEDTEINNLVDELLTGIESDDFYAEEVEVFQEDVEEQAQFSEKNLNYINELNYSQEQAIINVDKKKKLVIQGPPGTGKSQTITSLIADAVNKGQNVIMVSQKKAALDVIHSRLGNLSNFAIMLNDVKDKEGFYKQLYNLFLCNKDNQFLIDDFNKIASNIDERVVELESIASKLYATKINGIEMFRIYQDNENNCFKNNENELNEYYKNIEAKLLSFDYLELKSIRNKFTNEIILKDCAEYLKIIENFPWLQDVKDNIKQIDKNNMIDLFQNFADEQTEYLSFNPFKKIFKCANRIKQLNFLYGQYFKNDITKKKIYQNPKILVDGIKLYSTYQGTKELFYSLTNNEQYYLKSICKMQKVTKDSLSEINKKLFDFVVYCVVSDFENENRGVFANISNFSIIVSEISKLISMKKELTKARLKSILSNAYYDQITFSKRYNEICRQIENTRKWSVAKFIKKFSIELLKGIKIWLMTPEAVSEVLPLENGLFDLLIFDEASQIYIEKGIPSISRANKVVVAGDHKQLRPSNLGFGRIDIEDEELIEEDMELNAALEEESLLDLARFKYPSVLLNYHYRSRYEELINFSNYAFYHGKLNVSPNMEELDNPPIEVIKIDNGLWINRSNKNEALKVVEMIKKFLLERKNQETLGVITFNSNQSDMIMDELDKECLKDQEFSIICKKEFERKENGEDIGLFIKNIENVQGDERDCIMFSIGYAKNETGKVVRNFGWLNQAGGENRLNVAITRAKKKIFVITSILPDELYVDDLKNQGPKLFKKYLEYCWAVNNKNKELTQRILLSFSEEEQNNLMNNSSFDNDFEKQVYDALVKNGLKVDTQVGIGGYKIDLALKDKMNKKYVLGIECDGKLYRSPMVARERDIFRQKYLESRGWTIYRIWSNNWWHNPQKEIENILKIYNSLTE